MTGGVFPPSSCYPIPPAAIRGADEPLRRWVLLRSLRVCRTLWDSLRSCFLIYVVVVLILIIPSVPGGGRFSCKIYLPCLNKAE
jgi:hypothetical protein